MTDMHPEDIKAEIRKRGYTLAALAREHGVSKQQLSMAIGSRVSARCERIIADFLSTKPHRIWPSRYHKHGARIELRAPNGSRKAAA